MRKKKSRSGDDDRGPEREGRGGSQLRARFEDGGNPERGGWGRARNKGTGKPKKGAGTRSQKEAKLEN